MKQPKLIEECEHRWILVNQMIRRCEKCGRTQMKARITQTNTDSATKPPKRILKDRSATCLNCNKKFIRPCTAPKQKFCCRKCVYEKHKNDKEYLNKVTSDKNYFHAHKRRDAEAEKLHFKKNRFSDKKFKYDQSIIDHSDSPTGKAYIGLAKEPLMKSENHGYQGVILQSENRELMQCHECGRWFKFLTSFHLKRHGLNHETYKEKYGINKGTALISDVHSNWCAEHVASNITKKHKCRFDNADYRKLAQKKLAQLKRQQSTENQNLFGTCPLQLKEATFNYIHRYKRIPAKSYRHFDNSRGAYLVDRLCKRFGTITKALQSYGLPIRKPGGSGTYYLFPDGTKYFLSERYGRGTVDELYNLIKEKCLNNTIN